MPRTSTLFLGAVLLSGVAMADTAYVKPSTFSPELGQTITVEVAFNDYCCEPRYAVRTDTFSVIGPDKTARAPDRVDVFSTTTLLEQTLAAPGTTRITTGERLGRKGEYAELDGTYHLVNSPDAEPIEIPESTPILSSQTATVSDAYVSVGMQDWGAIRTQVGRLSIEPALHPNSVQVGAPFIGRVLMDGVPIADQKVHLSNETDRLYDRAGTATRTGRDGVFSFIFEDPGTHLIMVRLQAPAPADAETDIRSYTTSLTLDVSPD